MKIKMVKLIFSGLLPMVVAFGVMSSSSALGCEWKTKTVAATNGFAALLAIRIPVLIVVTSNTAIATPCAKSMAAGILLPTELST